ncbi:MAG TPA: ABC transporter substrate-binding protein [Candidatus Lustribacter sp.]|nr:ABC transporter substrate-binding protein [Candidatus Lustribacter sp.]
MIVAKSSREVTRVRHPAFPAAGVPGLWITSYLGRDATSPKENPPSPDALFPCAFLIEHDPGVAGPAHFHEANEFQVVVAGGGRFGKEPIAPLTVHFAAAYSPYGPIVADERGLSYMTLRDTYSDGAQMMPANRERLKAAGVKPRQSVAHSAAAGPSALRALAAPERTPVLAPAPDGMAAWSYRVPPGGSVTGDVTDGGGGQFWLVTGGAQADGNALLPPHSCTFVSADAGPFHVQAGPDGLEILALQFPVRTRERKKDTPMNDAPLTRRTAIAGLVAASAAASFPTPIRAASPPLRVAKSVTGVFAYSPIDVGLAKGYYKKAGVDLDVLTFNGAAKQQEAMIGGALDIMLGSGTTLITILKGEPTTCVAETLGPPYELAVMVPYDSPVKTVDDLKGKTFGVATTGSVTEWMVFELARVRGWGPNSVKTVATGGGPATIAGLRTHSFDAVVGTASAAYQLDGQKVVRIVLPCGDYVKNFIMHTIYASNDLIKNRPNDLRGFLAGWFAAATFMKANRAETIKIAADADGIDPPAQAKEYDLVAPYLSTDGKFNRQGLATIARSYVDLKMLDAVPDLTKTINEAYLPHAR